MSQQRIFITGASSGLGAALARAYAAPGVTLGLAARRIEKLETLKGELEGRGSRVEVYSLDVTDRTATQQAIDRFVAVAGGIDLVYANAGVYQNCNPALGHVGEMEEVIDVNVRGAIYTLTAALAHMVQAKAGRLVIIGSIAGFKGLPGGVYSASKVFVRYLADGWRADLAEAGVGVTVIYPGFIATEMTGEGKDYPFLISAGQAAGQIKGAVAAGKDEFMLPWQWRLIVPFLRFLPASLFARRF